MWLVAFSAAIGLVFGLVLCFTSGGSPVGWSMFGVLVVLPLVRLIITIDDDLPGGWSNPGGGVRPPWLYWESWGELAARGAIAGIGFAIDVGLYTAHAILFWFLRAAEICATVALHKRTDQDLAKNSHR